ncbi:Sensor histidine kinase TmoS [Enhygromyxa salina]|uniref:histidine kinase n=1 Tax=Enhygromyxa salina TaxID=215803 RepID=A0A2S9YG78_9BACT|nr:AAA family ATPase [Enhygromyxa salina]PRQ04098.1 Sensor histidine kinase TmoS [Enhygromyxa salina]
MGLALTGYRDVRLLRASTNARVYEAVRQSDDRSVIAKVFDLDHEDIEAHVEHEFALIERLEVEGVVRALGLVRLGEQLVLLLERAPGVNLATYTGGRALDLERFANIAVQLADILGRVHARRIIHRDIKPANILVDPASGVVHLADFGISVLLERERERVYDPDVIEGTLPYISPEQSGRTKRPVDFRSDLYSLGVTFYELLTGRRPFVHSEPLELIHAHLARTPEPPQRHRPELPPGFSRVVMKLLAKAPEHRYQSAEGLAADLRELRDRLARGDDGASVVLGLDDFSRELALPHQLYGRERERALLVDTLGRVARGDDARMVLLSGPAGIGKSALLADFEGELARVGSYVAHGRFESTRARPYSGLVDAFAGLVEQLLTESETRLERWRARLELALGGIARVMVELTPALGAVLGPQPELPPLDPRAARNRLRLAVTRFLSAFCERERPLILVLEDLQWADESSVELIEAILQGGEGGAHGTVLVVASAREIDDEDHPVARLCARLDGARITVERLGPLPQAAVVALLADALGRPPSALAALVRLVERKTGNNPRFIRLLLTHLAARELLTPSERGWQWELAALERERIPDDVLGVMELKLAALPPTLARIIQSAACIGDRFELTTLELVCEEPLPTLVAALYQLVELGLLDRLGNEHRFAHHDVRARARAQAGAERARTLRWQIGRQLLRAGTAETPAKRFELVEHLDAGLDEDRARELDDDSRVELAQLYADAGREALGSAAHDPALRYLRRGIELVDGLREQVEKVGQTAASYTLLVELHHSFAQVLALSGRPEAEHAFRQLLAWPLSDSDRGHVAASLIRHLHLTGRSADAVAHGLELMARWGCAVATAPSSARAQLSLFRARQRLRRIEPAELQALPICTDERAAALMDVLDSTKNATYILDPQLYLLLIATHVRWVLRHGLHESAPLALAQLGLSVGGFHKTDEAIRLSELARALSARFTEGPAQVRAACASHLFVSHLGQPFAEPIERMAELYPRALEAGDLLWAGYAGALSLSMHLEVGTHLTVLRKLCTKREREFDARTSKESLVIMASVTGFAAVVGGVEDSGEVASSHAWAAMDPELIERHGGSRYSIYVAAANLALVRVLLGDPREALRLCLGLLGDMEKVLFASWVIPRVALTLLVAAARVEAHGDERPPRLAAAKRRARRIIARWARGSHDNYGHYLELAAGLRALERRQPRAAASVHFERARSQAAEGGCRWVEGLAAEALADLAEREGLPGFAEGARHQAMNAYEAWGAKAKLEQMCAREAPAHAPTSSGAQRSTAGASLSRTTMTRQTMSATSTRGGSGKTLDFDGVLRSVAAIASELRLDEVIANVLEASLTNAGADHGALVLERDGVLGIVAQATIEDGPTVLDTPLALREAAGRAPTSVIHYVLRTEKALVVDDAGADGRFSDDPYVVGEGVLSLLGMPIRLGELTLGVLVLENRLSRECFSSERFEALQLIAGQAARALDRARIHGALRESEARWRSLVDGAPDLIALVDANGEVEFVNRNAQLEGPDHARVLRRFDRASGQTGWRDALEDVLRTGSLRELELELPGEDPSARPSWYVARLAPIADETEAPRKAIVIATDISARKRAEADARRLEAQLRQQQRLESLGTLASGVAHEINNPIQGIMNYAELIGTNSNDLELIADFSAEIHVECERVATIVRNLLAFSRQEPEQQQPIEDVDMAKLIEATLSLLRAVMRKDQIDVRVDIAAGLPRVRCRPQSIQQIIMNLVTNARDAINGAAIRADERRVIEIRAELLATDDGRRRLRVTVEDWGPGIPAPVLSRIFDPFFTTKGRDQGTGLGLAVSHGIAQEHDGELSVDSRPGQGTRFFLDLPLPGDAAASTRRWTGSAASELDA